MLSPPISVTARSWLAGLALVLASIGSVGAAEIRILVQQSPLAGSQYYAVDEVKDRIQVGDTLTLIREPDNAHDANAIRVEWQGRKLGYVPRAENRALAAAIDAGERVVARVKHLREHRDPWRRLEFEVYVVL